MDPSTSPASHRIVVVGSINADLSTRVARHPRPGETLHGTGGQVRPGGKGANQAAAAALMGGDVAMVGAVGEDAMAEDALTVLRECGADLAAVRRTEGPTGLAVVTVSEDGENTIVVVPGANGTLEAEQVREQAELIGAAEVVVLQGEIPRGGIEEAARLTRGRLILNPAPVLELDRDVLHRADPLVVNEHEAALVLARLDGSEGEDRGGSADGEARDPGAATAGPEALARGLHEAGIVSLVLTLGAQGALVGGPEEDLGNGNGDDSGADDAARSDAEDAWRLEAIPALRVEAVDTTGAGDAFVGALAVRLSEGRTLAEAARFATRVSAASVTREGAQSSYPRGPKDLPGAGGSGAASVL